MPLNILASVFWWKPYQGGKILKIFSFLGRNGRDDGVDYRGISSDHIGFCRRRHSDITALPAEDSHTPGAVCAVIRLITCPLIATDWWRVTTYVAHIHAYIHHPYRYGLWSVWPFLPLQLWRRPFHWWVRLWPQLQDDNRRKLQWKIGKTTTDGLLTPCSPVK
jgi:hypothetical protein